MISQRQKMLSAYEDNLKSRGVPFNGQTRPYKSTVPFTGVVVDPQPVDGPLAGCAFLVFAPQQQEAFSYGVGGARPSGIMSGLGAVTKTATEADTNIAKPRSTNGSEDFVIEAVSSSCASVLSFIGTSEGKIWTLKGGSVTKSTIADPNVVNALQGLTPLCDPGGILTPPQLMSPLNLEQALMEALAPHIAVEFEWNRSRVEKIGTLDQIGEGAGKSYLRAHGEPTSASRYKVPEGYVWRRDGQPDSDFIVRLKLTDTVVVPINCPQLGDDGGTPATNLYANLVFVVADIAVRLHGLGLSIPSSN